MDVFKATEHLVDEQLVMRVGQRLAQADDLVHVTFHQLLVKIDLVEVASGRVGDNVQVIQASDVLMTTEELQKLNLTKRTLAKDFLGKDVGDLLDGNVIAVALG